MGQLLAQILPVAVAIAVNPVPIIAAIVMTATERPTANGLAQLNALSAVSYGFGAAVLLIFHGAVRGAGTRTGHIVLVLWLLFGLGFLTACLVLLVRRRNRARRGASRAGCAGSAASVRSGPPWSASCS